MASVQGRYLMCRGVNSPLLKCLGSKKESDFYDNWNLWDGEKTCFCKECLNKIYTTYLKQTNSDKVALYYTCMQINLPFMQEVYDIIANKKDKNGNKVSITFNRYITELQKKTNKKNVWKDFSSSNITLDTEDDFVLTAEEQQKYNELEKIWGIQDDNKDFDFLEETFNRYTEGVEFVNSQQIDLYRDLCRDRLILRKINDNRYIGEETIDKVQTRIGKTMSVLKVDQFESTKPKTLSEQCMSTKIAQVELTKPCEIYKEPKKYKDFNKLEQYYKDLCLRPLLNTLAGTRDFNLSLDDIERYNLNE